MTGKGPPESSGGGKKRKRLPDSQLLILYFLANHKGYSKSIVQLSKDMDYSTDSSVNTNIHALIDGGYLEGPPYKLTKAGERELNFVTIPGVLLGFLIVIGGTLVLISLSALLGFGPISPVGTGSIGVAILVICYIFYRLIKVTFDDFFRLRKPLSTRESTIRKERDPGPDP